jgi:hypothetical protein
MYWVFLSSSAYEGLKEMSPGNKKQRSQIIPLKTRGRDVRFNGSKPGFGIGQLLEIEEFFIGSNNRGGTRRIVMKKR